MILKRATSKLQKAGIELEVHRTKRTLRSGGCENRYWLHDPKLEDDQHAPAFDSEAKAVEAALAGARPISAEEHTRQYEVNAHLPWTPEEEQNQRDGEAWVRAGARGEKSDWSRKSLLKKIADTERDIALWCDSPHGIPLTHHGRRVVADLRRRLRALRVVEARTRDVVDVSDQERKILAILREKSLEQVRSQLEHMENRGDAAPFFTTQEEWDEIRANYLAALWVLEEAPPA